MTDKNSQFMAILTNVGAAKLANATALGTKWNLAAMAVGDANETAYIPSSTQTKLVNERRRAPLNQVRVDPSDSSVIIAEQVIPPEIGGFWIYEVALYDDDGDMVAVANVAPTYKSLMAQGSGRTQVIRMNFVVSSAANVTLKIDPAVVLATREYVDLAIGEAFNKQDFKNSVLLATTGPVALSGSQVVDGETAPDKARVLAKDQIQPKENGIYIVSHSGPWFRSQDADASIEVTPGLMVPVEKGIVNGDSLWQLTSDAPVTLGSSALVFEKIAGRSSVNSGTYRSVTVDSMGRVVGGSNPTTIKEYGLVDAAPLASPLLSGKPKTPTASLETSDEQIANTEFVQALIAALIGGAPASMNTLNKLVGAMSVLAPLASPALSGTPKAPTPVPGANDDQIANTAFVQAIIAGLVGGAPASMNTLNKLVGAMSVLAPLASPALSGTPKAPTPGAGASIDQIANVQYVRAAIAELVGGAPDALNAIYELADAIGRDPNFAVTMNNNLAAKAPLNSPLLSGTPKAPTAPLSGAGSNNEQLANTQFVQMLLASFFPKRSFSANDFIRIPDQPGGLIIQFGSAVVSPEASYDVTLPVSFNTIRGAIAGMGVSGWSTNGNYNAYASIVSNSVIRLTQDVSTNTGANNQTLFYLAWGN